MSPFCFGKKEEGRIKNRNLLSFLFIAAITTIMNVLVFAGMDLLLVFLNIPSEIHEMMREYLWIIFWGLAAVFLYNYFTALLRSIGNSMVPLLFLVVSTIVNILLDLLFVITFQMGVGGAALATVIAQYISGIGITLYTIFKCPIFHMKRIHMRWDSSILKEISQLSVLTCLQQSVMNFGILMVQGLVNSFGTADYSSLCCRC